jgi:hypothetical protein
MKTKILITEVNCKVYSRSVLRTRQLKSDNSFTDWIIDNNSIIHESDYRTIDRIVKNIKESLDTTKYISNTVNWQIFTKDFEWVSVKIFNDNLILDKN